MKTNRHKWGKTLLILIPLVILMVIICLNVYTHINRQDLLFDSISDPIVNPLMGWAPWAIVKQSAQPHSLVYADLTWRDFEPEQGRYDFDSFEEKQNFDYWRAQGKHVVFRFVCDLPGSESHMDIPEWLYAAIGGNGDFYNNEYGEGFSPDYSHPLFIQYHKQAIQALGERYGKDGFFSYIELGSLGHWGEWHVYFESGIRRLPAEEIRNQYVQHYIDAFPNTFLLMRRPFNVAASHDLGLYNDMTGYPEDTYDWLRWIKYGGEFDETGEQNALTAEPDIWKIAPIGGEQTNNMTNEEIYNQNLDQTIALLKASHTTFIGPGSPYNVKDTSFQKGLDQVVSTIGYRLYVSELQIPKEIYFEDSIEGVLQIKNDGIAPFYYNWPVELVLIGSTGEQVKNFPIDLELNKVLPGELKKYYFNIPLDKVQNGTYKMGIAIIDPMINKPAIRFAMDNSRRDLIQELGEIKINRIINW